MGEFDSDKTGQAFGLVIAAAAATAIGSSAVFFPSLSRLATAPVLAASLGFAAGVMLYVSLVDIYGKAQDGFIEDDNTEDKSFIWATLTFFGGIFVMKGNDMVIHYLLKTEGHDEDLLHEGMDEMVRRNEEEQQKLKEATSSDEPDVEEKAGSVEGKERMLLTMGAATGVAIALHNFPEGLVTFVSYVEDSAVGVALAVGIAIHNIPEGLCVAMPIYYATGSKWQGFFWGTLSGFSEPLGALVGWQIVKQSFSGNANGILFGLVAGIMVYICVDELLPMAYKYNPKGTIVTWSVVFGMFLIALSLMLFSI